MRVVSADALTILVRETVAIRWPGYRPTITVERDDGRESHRPEKRGSPSQVVALVRLTGDAGPSVLVTLPCEDRYVIESLELLVSIVQSPPRPRYFLAPSLRPAPRSWRGVFVLSATAPSRRPSGAACSPPPSTRPAGPRGCSPKRCSCRTELRRFGPRGRDNVRPSPGRPDVWTLAPWSCRTCTRRRPTPRRSTRAPPARGPSRAAATMGSG
jgi:hypothetical protein